MTQYTYHTVADARAGDEILMAGDWVRVASVAPWRGSYVVRFVGGGSHAAPAHQFGKVRREAAK